ncbi:MAG TPA: twin-arginine translocase TatA/TatE family subunit [Polyangiaceae bacterium]|jgi:sec-independent protein translocase protein TatA|nr:twin-arginine translocase TatA/TatE family subunit [Polyangiaceae bacterium]
MGSLSPVHWLIVIVVVLLFFGPRRLAGIGQGLGQGFRELRKGLAEVGSDRETSGKS